LHKMQVRFFAFRFVAALFHLTSVISFARADHRVVADSRLRRHLSDAVHAVRRRPDEVRCFLPIDFWSARPRRRLMGRAFPFATDTTSTGASGAVSSALGCPRSTWYAGVWKQPELVQECITLGNVFVSGESTFALQVSTRDPAHDSVLDSAAVKLTDEELDLAASSGQRICRKCRIQIDPLTKHCQLCRKVPFPADRCVLSLFCRCVFSLLRLVHSSLVCWGWIFVFVFVCFSACRTLTTIACTSTRASVPRTTAPSSRSSARFGSLKCSSSTSRSTSPSGTEQITHKYKPKHLCACKLACKLVDVRAFASQLSPAFDFRHVGMTRRRIVNVSNLRCSEARKCTCLSSSAPCFAL
jgi:hypothetical protein